MMRQATLKQLRAVARIAETGNVSAAAEILNLSPPAVSLTLKLIEEHVGLPLFERVGGVFRPTSAGLEIVLAAHRIDTILRECGEVLDAIKGTLKGKITVGVVSTAKYFAPYALAAFREQHPEIDIVLHVGNREETIQRLQDYTIDLAVMGRPPQQIDVQRVEIGPHPHVLVAAPGHPLAAGGPIPPTALAGETFLLREPGSGTRMLAESIMSDIGGVSRTGMEISSNETIKQAVMAGLGIALLSAHTVAYEIGDGRLVTLPVKGTPVVRKWYVVRLTRKRMMPLTDAMWHFLELNGSKFLPQTQNWQFNT
jgi:LysR family transcriptional regulator, low CO2-responsive transcriptional regulator